MGRRDSILVIDDDAAVLRLIAQILSRAGYGVILAPGPEQALATFPQRAHEIGLVVCDVMMPGMCGPDLVDRLTAQMPDLPVLFISGYSQSELVDDRIVSRGLPLLLKPFTMSALVDKTRELLGGPARVKTWAGGTMAS